ncbi:unnamed protein product [Prorocentrum cordatum]|uniref:Nuclear envelope membrane protein n=1 Tax=Prorocentrum cordatum TaxID=2364126 RepID=A0ABN9RKY0_9DINO|nr:unnamed protein product [Polarella glacialis]
MGCPVKSFGVVTAAAVVPWSYLWAVWLNTAPNLLPGFLQGLSIDCGAAGQAGCLVPPLAESLWAKLAINLAMLLAWMVPHSVLPRGSAKRRLLPIFGKTYRSIYITQTLVELYALMLLWQPVLSDLEPIWDLSEYAWWFYAFQCCNNVLLSNVAIHCVDVMEHLGIYMSFDLKVHQGTFGLPSIAPEDAAQAPVPEFAGLVLPFTERGFYAVVRHPLMLSLMMQLYITPLMTWNRLAFVVPVHAYIEFVTFFLEEPDYEAYYGEVYKDYKKRVDARFPFLGMLYAPKKKDKKDCEIPQSEEKSPLWGS